MRLLKSMAAVLLFALVSCAPAGPLTPREAFLQLKYAYLARDVKSFMNCISKKSIDSISREVALIQAMPEKQRAAIAAHYGLKESAMKQITVRHLVFMHFQQEKKRPALSDAVKFSIVGIERKKDRALVKVENGMELIFMKEGPYWKFDLSAY